MTRINARTSRMVTGAVVGSFALTAASSLRARGLGQTLLFATLGVGLPVFAEYHAINTQRVLRHHLQPQIKGVPLAIGLAWYLVGYNTFTMVESALVQRGVPTAWRRWLLPVATALVATSMDLVSDVAMLDQGYWEWAADGPYAAMIAGPNGKHGVPVDNFSGWLTLTSLVTALFVLLGGRRTPPDALLLRAGQQSALLLLPSYLGAVAWELRQRRWRYVFYSALFPIVVFLALLRRRR